MRPVERDGMDPAGDARLVRRVRDGDPGATDAFVRAYWHELHRAAYLLLHDSGAAEDVAQESILAALRGLDAFEDGRPIRPWIRRIAVNRAIDSMRARGIRPELALEFEAVDEGEEEALGEQVAALALSDRLTSALGRLAEPLRVAVVLRHLFEYAPGEISEITGTPAATVRTHVHRGLLQLRAELGSADRSTA